MARQPWRAALAITVLAASLQAQAQAPGSVERGKYLMNTVVACGNCHFQRGPQGQPLPEKGLSGGMVFDEPPFKAYATNLTPDAETGIGKRTDAQLAKAIREGVRPDIGHCMECHTPRSEKGLVTAQWGAGGQMFKGPWGTSVARNLTPHATGLKDWTDAEIAKAIRTGMDRKGQPYKPPMGFPFYAGITDEDMSALIAYLRSLKPQAFAGK